MPLGALPHRGTWSRSVAVTGSRLPFSGADHSGQRECHAEQVPRPAVVASSLIGAVRRGDLPRARAINRSLVPLINAIMRTSQGPIMAKGALAELGILDHATVRLPLLESPPEDLDKLRLALAHVPIAA